MSAPPPPSRLLSPTLPPLAQCASRGSAFRSVGKANSPCLVPKIPSLKLHDQIRLADRLQRHLDRPRFLALQLHAHFPIRKSRQPPFKKLRLAHRLAGRNLRQPPPETFEVRRLLQRPVNPRRTDLPHIPRPGYQFLDVEDHAQLLADALAVRVADLRGRITLRLFSA